jgi:hypothetical protein
MNAVRIYREYGWTARVLVLADHSDQDCEQYSLRVLETLSPSPVFAAPPDGTEFTVSQCRKSFFDGMWSLTPPTAAEAPPVTWYPSIWSPAAGHPMP